MLEIEALPSIITLFRNRVSGDIEIWELSKSINGSDKLSVIAI